MTKQVSLFFLGAFGLILLLPSHVQAKPKLEWWLGKTKHTRLALKLHGFVRPEWMTNRGDYRFSTEDSDFYVATRVRIGGEIEYKRSVGLRVTLQDSRFWGNGLSQGGKIRFTTASSERFSREVFLGVQLFETIFYLRWAKANVRFEAGRMRLKYGNYFLLGDPGFFPPGQSFDGMRLRWSPGTFRIDFKWILIRESLATTQRPDCQGSCFFEGDHMAGIYASKKWGKHETDLYGYYYQRAPRAATLKEPSRFAFLGLRYFFQNKTIRALLEGQLQVGRHQDKQLLASAGIFQFRYTIPVRVKPFLEVQFLYATGDPDPADEADNNFVALFLNRRAFYGLTNQYGLSNIIQPMLRLGIKPHKQVSLSVDARYNWKFSAKGTLVGGGSHNPTLADLTGQDGVDIGAEVNLRVKYKPFSGVTFDLGAGMFLPTQELNKRSASGDTLATLGTDPAFMTFLVLWLHW